MPSYRFDDWDHYVVENCFSIDLPPDTVITKEHDDELLVIQLPTDPTSNVLVGLFPRQGKAPITRDVLRDELQRFMLDCAHLEHATYEEPGDFDIPGMLAQQSVGLATNNVWWIARAYGRSGSQELLLVHWQGSEEQLFEIVLPILVSVTPHLNE